MSKADAHAIDPLLPSTAPEFLWQEGNTFHLLVNGDAYFSRMLESIRQAHRHIWLEMYLMESGHVANGFIEALSEAASRGVEVLVVLDAVGSRALKTADVLRMQHAGVRIRWYNPVRLRRHIFNLMRDHRKLLLVDGLKAYVGGTGLTDDFAPSGSRLHWRETMIEIHGPVLRDWESLFLSVWNSHNDHPHHLPVIPKPASKPGMQGRVSATQAAPPLRIQSALLSEIRHARQRVWIASPYFIPSRKVRKTLVQAKRRGADVRLLMPGQHTDHPLVRLASRALYHGLLKNGITIYEYQPRFLHMKVTLCDNWCAIGSSNLDRWGLVWNLEANQEIRSASFTDQVAQMLEQDFADSQKVDLSSWLSRPLWSQTQEAFWGGFSSRFQRSLEKLGQRYRKLRK